MLMHVVTLASTDLLGEVQFAFVCFLIGQGNHIYTVLILCYYWLQCMKHLSSGRG